MFSVCFYVLTTCISLSVCVRVSNGSCGMNVRTCLPFTFYSAMFHYADTLCAYSYTKVTILKCLKFVLIQKYHVLGFAFNVCTVS